jgi:hypothetical protein
MNRIDANSRTMQDTSSKLGVQYACSRWRASATQGQRLEQLQTSQSAKPIPARLLPATRRYVGEGFDDARLDTLFLTLPISWHGTIAQYVGRLHRLYEGKREVCVYDYADLNVPMLARMFDRRCRGYETIGYAIELPGSAVPGWPADVPLPVDPPWKSQYAASVRRLVHDGVDSPLESPPRKNRPSPWGEGVRRWRFHQPSPDG